MMKKHIWASLFVAIAFLTGCDYTEKYFEGYDDNPITDVAQFEGDFTGNYPAEGYFTSREAVQTAVNTMLKGMFPYCDAGSAAKVNLLYGDVTVDYEPVTPDVEYTLEADDYDAMGTESGQPGKFNNFDASMDVDAYLKAFCAEKYASLADGKIVNITYAFYASGATSDLVKTYKKTAGEWEEFSSFTPDMTYELVTEDYDSMGTESGTPGRFDNFDSSMDIDFYLSVFLRENFPYVKAGTTCEVTYKYYASRVTTDQSSIYKYDGASWSAYDPFAEILTVSTKIAEMKYDGSAWVLERLLGGTQVLTMAAADYRALVDWVIANKPEYLSTQYPDDEEYYFGASAKYSNINNRYNTWKSYYNVGDYLKGLSDDETQAIMDERMEYAIAEILLPSWIAVPDTGLSYVVVYKIYGGRGDGNYAMSFMYNEETGKYEKTAGPVAR